MDHVCPGRAQPALNRRSRSQSGFTLIEILVVVFIIGLLATIVSVQVFDKYEQAKRTKAGTDIAAIKAALHLYKLDHGQYPSTAQGLGALLETPPGGEESYIERVQEDPWGNEYVYASDGRQFRLRSLARDGNEGGEGLDADISNDDA